MGVYEMSGRRKLLLGALALAIIISIAFVGFRASNPTEVTQEPERGGPAVIAIGNTEKLNAILPPSQFFATKDQLSAYMRYALDENVTAASIDDTQLNQDGSVALTVSPNQGRPFTAIVYASGDQFVFQIPASNYTKTMSVDGVEALYGE